MTAPGLISHNGGMASAPVAVDASDGSTLPHEPTGYILSHGVSYKGVSSNGKALTELPACPPSATAAHDAFVSKCGFSSTFSPTLNEDVTKSRMVEDVRRVATTIASHDVVVVYFSGHGERMDDTTCVIDSAGCVVSVRKLQAVFAETVVERDVRNVAFVVILDCCQTLSSGTVLALVALCSWCGDFGCCLCTHVQGRLIRVMIGTTSIFARLMRTNARGLWDSRQVQVRLWPWWWVV